MTTAVPVNHDVNPGRALRVVIVDDSSLVRRMLTTAADIVGECEIVGEAVNGRTAVEVCAELKPQAVVLDVEMPVMDGVDAITPILSAAPTTKVVMFSSDTSREGEALAAGASGFFQKGMVSPIIVLRKLAALCAHSDDQAAPRHPR